MNLFHPQATSGVWSGDQNQIDSVDRSSLLIVLIVATYQLVNVKPQRSRRGHTDQKGSSNLSTATCNQSWPNSECVHRKQRWTQKHVGCGTRWKRSCGLENWEFRPQFLTRSQKLKFGRNVSWSDNFGCILKLERISKIKNVLRKMINPWLGQ